MSTNLKACLLCGVSDYDDTRHGRPHEAWRESCETVIDLIPVESYEALKARQAPGDAYDLEAYKSSANELLTVDGKPRTATDVFLLGSDEYGCANVTGFIVDRFYSFQHLTLLALASCDAQFQRSGWQDVPKMIPPASVPERNHHLLPTYPIFPEHLFKLWKLAAQQVFQCAGMTVPENELKLIFYWEWS